MTKAVNCERKVRERYSDIQEEHAGPYWCVHIYFDAEHCESFNSGVLLDRTEAWSAAYAFTLQREQEIRWKREEIAFVDARLITANVKEMPVRKRILAVLEGQLGELQRGMKGGAGHGE